MKKKLASVKCAIIYLFSSVVTNKLCWNVPARFATLFLNSQPSVGIILIWCWQASAIQPM